MFRQIKISFRLLILFAICCMVYGSAIAQPLRRLQDNGTYGKPNIILFVADNFNCDDVELVCSNRSNFPNLNKLITNGIYFSHFYSVDTDPKQSRACLLTGIHPIKQPLLESGILNPEFRTIADILKECGYRSGILGKWALGGKPIGFNEWFGYLSDEEAKEQYPPFLWRNDKKWEFPANQSGKKIESAQSWFIKTTTNFLRIYREYPFFLYLPSNLPGKSTNQADRHKSLQLIDEHIGKTFEYLEYYHLLDKSIILFTSIQSENIHTADTDKIKQFIQRGLNIPTIAYWQGNLKHQTNNALFYSCDIAPTILELADSKLTTNCFSQPLFPKQKPNPRDIILLRLESSDIKYLILSENVAGLASTNLSRFEFFSFEKDDKKDNDQFLNYIRSKANDLLNCLINVKTSR